MDDESKQIPATVVPDIAEPTDDTSASLSKPLINRARLRSHLTIFSLYLAQFLAALDVTIVGVALPTIASQLHSSSAQYTWVASSYLLASTSSTPLWVKISDVWGRKPILIIANAIFMAGSLVAAMSRTPNMLIGGRALQGLGAGGISILVTVIIGDLFELRERAKYFAFSAVVYGISSGIGPILGGSFTSTIGWRWCFYINLPFDGLSLFVLFACLRLHKPTIPVLDGLKSFDWIGSSLILGGTLCFLYGLENGAGNHDWTSATTLSLIIIGVVLMLLFILYEWCLASFPIMPVRVLATLPALACLLTAALHGFVFISYDYFLPLYFQTILGASPLQSGLYIFALIIPLCIMSMATGPIMKKTGGFRLAIWIGVVLMTVGTGLFINLPPSKELWKLIVYQIIAGVGSGLLFVPPMIALQSLLKPEHVAAGSSAFTFLRNLLTSLSVVVGGAILERRVGKGGLTNVSESPVAAGHKAAAKEDGGPQLTSPKAFMTGLREMWIFYCCVAGCMIIFACMIVHRDIGKRNGADKNLEEISTGARLDRSSRSETSPTLAQAV